jgi:CheY-like chemotaxis protein
MDKASPDQAGGLIVDSARRLLLQPTAESLQAAADFALAARVESHLADKGHFLGVTALDGALTLTVNKHVLMFAKLEAELTRLVSGLAGVKTVTVKAGPGFHQADTYRHVDLELPSKILLVDDEAEFVETLSERLLARDLGSVVVYDGRQALEVVAQEEPEVMVLDLKMPGLPGLEVLRRIKADHPRVEVIILTGHGSEADRRTALELGAFAYLQKPVEIEVLGQTLKEAYRAAKEKAGGGAS